MSIYRILATTLAAYFISYPAVAQANKACSLELRPVTTGFFLNPTLEKLYVQKVSPSVPGQDCRFAPEDEITQINDLIISGRKAREVMEYWKSLPSDIKRVYLVRRGDEVLRFELLSINQH